MQSIAEPGNRSHSHTERAGQHLENTQGARYLGVTITAAGRSPETQIQRIKNTLKLTHAMHRMRIHSGDLTTNASLRLLEAFVILRTAYALHLTPKTTQLEEALGQLEKVMLIGTMGCYSPRRKRRLLTIGKIENMDQR